MDEREDAYGRLILDAIDGKKPIEVVERDDGFVFAYHGDYLIEPFRRWQPVERRAQRFVRGRVLDIGGAGRVCLHLQDADSTWSGSTARRARSRAAGGAASKRAAA